MSTHRVNVNFTASAYGELSTLAERQGKSVSDVIRTAIAFSRWWDDERRSGSRILVERDGQVREVVDRG